MEQNLCVLIDFENLAAGTEKEGLGKFDIKAVMRRVKDKGRILVARGYGDWGRFAKFKQYMLEAGVTMMELSSYRGSEKNRADIALVVDAMELAFTRDHIGTFVVVSGDSDFTPLIHKLKELDKRVIGLGTRGSTSRLLIENCDEFIFYESLKKGEVRQHKPEKVEPEVQTPNEDEAFALLVEVLEGLHKDNPEPVLASVVKGGIQRKYAGFDEGEYGYSGFARFLDAAKERGLVDLVKDEKAGGYRVDLPSEDEKPTAAPQLPELPPLTGQAAEWRNLLQSQGINPLDLVRRHTVVNEFVDHVAERAAKKRKNTMMYVVGDIARRCRKTDPMVPTRYVRAVVTALGRAGALLHSDGTPVRSPTAPFRIQGDSDELLDMLKLTYVTVLIELGEDLSDTAAVAQLLWNDDAPGHVQKAADVVERARAAVAEAAEQAEQTAEAEAGAPA